MSQASTTDATPVAQQRRPGASLQRLLHNYPAISPAIILVVIIVAFTIVNPRFASPTVLSLLLQQTAVIAALAVGQTLIILTAGIDLSVGAIAIFTSLMMAELCIALGVPGALSLLIGGGLGLVAGALNGGLVSRLSLPPFIVTLGTLSIFTAISLLISGGQSTSARDLPSILSWTGLTFSIGAFDLTTGVLLVLAMYAVVGYALTRTSWGTHVYAVGGDSEASRLAGIRSKQVILSVYVVAGLTYAVAAWVLIGRAGAATPNGIVDGNLQSITAVVIGGTSLFGGRGGLIGTLLGALIVQSLAVGLSLAGVDAQYRLLAVGVLVLLAVALDQWIRKSR